MGDETGFPSEILQQVPSLLCRVRSGIVMKQHRNIVTQTGKVSPDGISQAFQRGAVLVGVNCGSVFQEVL
jgi:hypothetical protein